MKNPDGSIPVPEDHKATAMELFIQMDMLDFEYIVCKMRLMDAAKAADYEGYRNLQRVEMPSVQQQHRQATASFWNFIKECVPEVGLSRGSVWEFDPLTESVIETRRAAAASPFESPGGLILPGM